MIWIFLKKLYWIIHWIEFHRKMNEWIIFWINICHFWWKVPFFVYFGHFLDNFWTLFLFDQCQWFPDCWIELSFELNQQNFFFNWIIFWIESWVKQYWIEYWMNHFFWQNSNIELNLIGYRRPLRLNGGRWNIFFKGEEYLCRSLVGRRIG